MKILCVLSTGTVRVRFHYFYLEYCESWIWSPYPQPRKTLCWTMKLCQASGKSHMCYLLRCYDRLAKLDILAKMCWHCCLESTWTFKSSWIFRLYVELWNSRMVTSLFSLQGEFVNGPTFSVKCPSDFFQYHINVFLPFVCKKKQQLFLEM